MTDHPTSDELCMQLRDIAHGMNSAVNQSALRLAADRIEQLQMPHTDVLRLAELPDGADTQAMLKALSKKIEAQRRRIVQLERDAKEEAKAVAAEALWQERQGEDYGSY